MSEFSIKNNIIKLGQNEEKCVYEHSGFIDIHEKRLSVSRHRRFLDERTKYKPVKEKCLIKKK